MSFGFGPQYELVVLASFIMRLWALLFLFLACSFQLINHVDTQVHHGFALRYELTINSNPFSELTGSSGDNKGNILL